MTNIVRVRSDGSIEIEVPFDRIEEMFRNVGPIQEVFALTEQCGKCGSKHTRLSHRAHQDYDFFEGKCIDCGAALKFGQRKDGTGLFPKTKNEDGSPMDDDGWSIYQPSGGGWSKSKGADTGSKHAPADTEDVDDSEIPF